MIRFYRLFFVLLIFVLVASEVFGQGGQDRAGTTAAPELRIPVGGRYLAMGGSPVASVSGLEAIYWNPAGVYLTDVNASAIFSHRQYIAEMGMNYVAVSGNFGSFGTLALSFRSLDIGDINVTTLDQPDGTGEIITPTYFILGLTYSRQLSDRISVGTTMNIIDESWANVGANGFSFDMGVQYRDLFISGLSFGVVVKNLGGTMQYDGSDLFVQAAQDDDRGNTFYKVVAGKFELPSEIGLGLSYTRQIDTDNLVSVSGSFTNNNFTYDDYKVGIEYSYADILFVRGGYLFSPNSSDDTPNIFEDYSLGFGLNTKSFSGFDISVDYAYVPVKYFDANNTFSIRVNF